jgi:hypothetical protein
MRSTFARSKATKRLAIFLIVIGVLVAMPLLSGAHPPVTKEIAKRSAAISITIVNNSQREIRHVYLSPSNQDNWGPDQLNGSAISSGGGSYTLSSVSCDQTSIKVIAEDQNGCFLYKLVACADNATWTITNDATPDCGG